MSQFRCISRWAFCPHPCQLLTGSGSLWCDGFETQGSPTPGIFTPPPAHWKLIHTHPYLYLLHTGKVWYLGNFSWQGYFFKNIPSAIQCPNFIIRFHSDETLDGLWHSHFSLLIFYSLLETRLCFKKKLLEQFINSWIKATLLFGTWGIKQLAKIKSLTS